MRSPFNTTQNQFPNPKPTNPPPPTTITTTTTTTTNHNNHIYSYPNNLTVFANPQFNYEPTSVLELRRSPSPVNNFPAISGVSDDSPLPWDEDHVAAVTQPHLLSSEDWDSMMLGLSKDDSVSINLPIPDESNNQQFLLNDFNNFPAQIAAESNQDSSIYAQLEELIRAAVCYESNDSPSAHAILARLNQLSSAGKPLQRAAYYFKEALLSLLSANFVTPSVSPLEIVHKIKAYKTFSELSPVTMFANFTANQTLLESLDGVGRIHIIDFEIGIGGQWASFMQEIACKAKSRNAHLPSLRITAVISRESAGEAALISDNLHHFARELGVPFQLDFICFDTFQQVYFNAVTFIAGESLALNLSPKIFRHLRTPDCVGKFLRFLRRLSPKVTVFVDFEGSSTTDASLAFHRKFASGIEFYSSLLESLDVANTSNGVDRSAVRRIETFLMRPKIFAGVAAAANCVLPWRELFEGVGMAAHQFSGFTESQAEWLVRRAQVRGFHVAKRHGSMLLCWHGRELVATSAWKCAS